MITLAKAFHVWIEVQHLLQTRVEFHSSHLKDRDRMLISRYVELQHRLLTQKRLPNARGEGTVNKVDDRDVWAVLWGGQSYQIDVRRLFLLGDLLLLHRPLRFSETAVDDEGRVGHRIPAAQTKK
jgi:hypothetical protein